jgi:hypothetical protein
LGQLLATPRPRQAPEPLQLPAALTDRLDVAWTGAGALDAWVRYIDTWREGVHDLLTKHVAIFLE